MNIVIFSAIIFTCGHLQQDVARTIFLQSQSQETVSPLQEKLSRTPSQKKIDSHLLRALKCAKSKSKCEDQVDDLVKMDAKGRVKVDIRAVASPKLLALIRKLEGKVITVFKQYKSIEALLPLVRLEDLADSTEVRYIGLPAQPMTSEHRTISDKP